MEDTDKLEEYCNELAKTYPEMPPFSELSDEQKRVIKDSYGFARWRLSRIGEEAAEEFRRGIVNALSFTKKD